jgi:hypothetical protein
LSADRAVIETFSARRDAYLGGTQLPVLEDKSFVRRARGDDEFQRVQLVAFEYIPLPAKMYLGLRGDGTASFGDAPFYFARLRALVTD